MSEEFTARDVGKLITFLHTGHKNEKMKYMYRTQRKKSTWKDKEIRELLLKRTNADADVLLTKPDDLQNRIYTTCYSSCVLYPEVTPCLNCSDILMLLSTCLTWTISCCIFHMRKAMSGKMSRPTDADIFPESEN